MVSFRYMSEPDKRTVSIRLDHKVYANACEIADSEDRSFNNWVNRVIETAIATHRGNTTLVPPGSAEVQFRKHITTETPTSLRYDPEAMPPGMPDPGFSPSALLKRDVNPIPKKRGKP